MLWLWHLPAPPVVGVSLQGSFQTDTGSFSTVLEPRLRERREEGWHGDVTKRPPAQDPYISAYCITTTWPLSLHQVHGLPKVHFDLLQPAARFRWRHAVTAGWLQAHESSSSVLAAFLENTSQMSKIVRKHCKEEFINERCNYFYLIVKKENRNQTNEHLL